MFQEHQFLAIVLDEAHMIKNPKTKLSGSVKSLFGQVRLGLTGTPIQNNVAELWSIFDFLIPSYLGDTTTFKQKFKPLLDLHLISLDTKKIELTNKQEEILKELHQKVLPFIMRREKGEVLKDLPPKIIEDFSAELTEIQKKIYEKFKSQDLKTAFKPGEDLQKAKSNFLQVLSQLR